jgi:hypothetical protein
MHNGSRLGVKSTESGASCSRLLDPNERTGLPTTSDSESGHNRPPARQQAAVLFDDLVGEAEQRDRNGLLA